MTQRTPAMCGCGWTSWVARSNASRRTMLSCSRRRTSSSRKSVPWRRPCSRRGARLACRGITGSNYVNWSQARHQSRGRGSTSWQPPRPSNAQHAGGPRSLRERKTGPSAPAAAPTWSTTPPLREGEVKHLALEADLRRHIKELQDEVQGLQRERGEAAAELSHAREDQRRLEDRLRSSDQQMAVLRSQNANLLEESQQLKNELVSMSSSDDPLPQDRPPDGPPPRGAAEALGDRRLWAGVPMPRPAHCRRPGTPGSLLRSGRLRQMNASRALRSKTKISRRKWPSCEWWDSRREHPRGYRRRPSRWWSWNVLMTS
eukprot:jgi/Botrbrau1/15196/Bobra.0149s0057.1